MKKFYSILSATNESSFSMVFVVMLLFSINSIGAFAADKSSSMLISEKKIERMAKKDAKRYAKEHWETKPGALPLELQLIKSYKLQNQEEGESPLYFNGDASSIGEFYDAAHLSATAYARVNLAGNIISFIEACNKIDAGNLQQDATVSVMKTILASKERIAAQLKNIIVPVVMYKKHGNEVEVRVMVYYNKKEALSITKEITRQQLLEESEKLYQEELNRIFENAENAKAQ